MTTKRTLGLRDLRARVGQLDAIIRQLEAEKAMILQLTTREEPKKRYRLRKK